MGVRTIRKPCLGGRNKLYIYIYTCTMRASVVSSLSRILYVYMHTRRGGLDSRARAAPFFSKKIFFLLFFAYHTRTHVLYARFVRAGTVAITSTHCAAVTHAVLYTAYAVRRVLYIIIRRGREDFMLLQRAPCTTATAAVL